MKCRKGHCVVGHIANQPIKEKDWLREANKFQDMIVDWNERTKRFAIPHPGFCQPARFCGMCGRPLEQFHKENRYEIKR